MADKQAKEQTDHDTETPFERFEAFAKRLLAVSKEELDTEIAKENSAKHKVKSFQKEGSE